MRLTGDLDDNKKAMVMAYVKLKEERMSLQLESIEGTEKRTIQEQESLVEANAAKNVFFTFAVIKRGREFNDKERAIIDALPDEKI